MSLSLTLPWPPKELTPNFKRRNHWSRYAKPTKRYRTTCWALAREARIDLTGMDAVPLSITFHPPDRRKRDDDGCIGAFKAGRDGIAEAFGVDDNAFRPSYHMAEPVKGGAIIVTVDLR